MIDPRRTGALTDFLVTRLVTVHDGGGHEVDTAENDLPAALRLVDLEAVEFYVQPDPGDPTSGRPPAADAVLLSACVAREVADTGAVGAAVHAFRTDPSTPADLHVTATSADMMQVWLDRTLPTNMSDDVAAMTLDDFVAHALRLRGAMLELDLTTSEEARRRAASGGFTEPVSYDVVEESDWAEHPWLSRLQWVASQSADGHVALFDLTPEAARLFEQVHLQIESNDGTWETVPVEMPGPPIPARGGVRPAIAWFDLVWWRYGYRNDPDGPTGRWRALVPTGWVGPPV